MAKSKKNNKSKGKVKIKYPITPRPPYSAAVEVVLGRLGTSTTPVYLPFHDVNNGYLPSHCHINVKHYVGQSGGRRLHGWVIWQFATVAHAEFHSVWEDPSGNLFNLTPHRNGQTEIMFVADPGRTITINNGLHELYCDVGSYTSGAFYRAGSAVTDSPKFELDVTPLAATMVKFGLSDLT